MIKIILFFLLANFTVSAQFYSSRDVEICNSKFQLAVTKNLGLLTIGDVLAEIGKSFVGTEYTANSLDKEGEEQLIINLTGVDCTTFLENALAFSLLTKKRQTTFEDYQKELSFIRYRDGIINQYPSRLHYFSDWIHNNQQKKIIKDITEEIGGDLINFNLNFMSTHTDSYKYLKENPDFIPIIEKNEKEISSRSYHYIPKEKISLIEDKIQNGDLIAFTTSIKGLDIGHVGIAIKSEDGRIRLLHAPQVGQKVQITEQPLSDYAEKINKHTGIIVLRSIEPE